MIFVSSKSVTKRGVIQKELRRALVAAERVPEGEIFIIPVLLDDTPLRPPLSSIQAIDPRALDVHRGGARLKHHFARESKDLIGRDPKKVIVEAFAQYLPIVRIPRVSLPPSMAFLAGRDEQLHAIERAIQEPCGKPISFLLI